MKFSLSARRFKAISSWLLLPLVATLPAKQILQEGNFELFTCKVFKPRFYADKQPTKIISRKNLIFKMVDFRLRFSSIIFRNEFSAQLARLENGFWKAKFRHAESFGKIGERQAKISGSVSQRQTYAKSLRAVSNKW